MITRPSAPARLWMLATVAVLSIATVAGIIALWPRPLPVPDGGRVPLVDGVIRSATVIDCPQDPVIQVKPPCVLAEVEVLEGDGAGTVFEVDTGEQNYPPFRVGERVEVAVSEGPEGDVIYGVADYARLGSLAWLFGLFVVAVLAFGRWHGLRSLLGLALSLLIVVQFVVPAMLSGRNPLAVAVVGAFGVMLVTLYLAHGVNAKTTAALVGTAAALILTAGLGVAFAEISKLTGLSSEDAQLVQSAVAGVNLRGLVLAGLVIGALGVLDDVTVSQASTVFAVHGANPRQTWGQVFRRAMSVGRDHIASTVNTLVLAYAGASIPLLLLFSVGGAPVLEILNTELVAEEIVATLVGSLGLIAAVPLTTALATTMVLQTSDPESAPTPEVRAHDDWIRQLRDAYRP